jgi:hypothetical protein
MKELIICLIYTYLPPEQQAKIFKKISKGTSKVVLAINIVEANFIINGIRYVIDTIRGRIFFAFILFIDYDILNLSNGMLIIYDSYC